MTAFSTIMHQILELFCSNYTPCIQTSAKHSAMHSDFGCSFYLSLIAHKFNLKKNETTLVYTYIYTYKKYYIKCLKNVFDEIDAATARISALFPFEIVFFRNRLGILL